MAAYTASTSGSADSNDHSIFVGDLAQDVNDQYLEMFFRTYFASVKGAKVILDPATGRSRGYGFVRFGSEEERDKALKDMNGVFISSRPVRVSLATARKPGDPPVFTKPAGQQQDANIPGELDPYNTTIFVGNISPMITEDILRQAFAPCGDIVYVKIPVGKNCGFVQFAERRMAEYALEQMQGQFIGSCQVRLGWGRGSARAGVPATAPSYGAAGYGYGAYDGYSYASYDPYGAYNGYGDPYSAYYGAASYGAPTAAAAAGAPASAPAARPPGQVNIYDPLAAVSVDKMNNVFIHRTSPTYTGACYIKHG